MDSLNVCLLFLGILYRLLFQESIVDGFLGLLLGALFPGIIAWIFFKLKNQMGMGGGDIKLYGALGMFLGPYDIFLTIFYSSLLGIVFFLLGLLFKKIKKDDPLPFGPSILIVAFVQIFLSHLYQ
jgi:prepilin signal peptidase PulO-like enzyme (type II secretory pathway)